MSESFEACFDTKDLDGSDGESDFERFSGGWVENALGCSDAGLEAFAVGTGGRGQVGGGGGGSALSLAIPLLNQALLLHSIGRRPGPTDLLLRLIIGLSNGSDFSPGGVGAADSSNMSRA